MGGKCSTHGRDEKCVENFGQKSRQDETTQRPRHRREDNIRIDLRETGWEGVDWMHLVQDRDNWWTLVNTVMNHPGSIHGGKFLD
jgi:hypothetical protein